VSYQWIWIDYYAYGGDFSIKAVTFQGARDIKVKNVDDPKIDKYDDILVKVTSTANCGSDLHIYLGAMSTHKDYVIGHEPMGIVEEAATAYQRFHDHEDECINVILKP
jgi:threonine dehydrogenase-like Zn-dependent dehydrogenase